MIKPIIAVVGPTASGKTELSVRLAKYFSGEIISCDSMQIYKDMDIGTAKPTPEEMDGVAHYLIGTIDTDTPFSVSDYVELAESKVKEISERNRIPFLVGGTGLYARSLLYGIEFKDNSRDNKLREELLKQSEEGKLPELYETLTKLDPEAAEKIHINNTKRVLRALEYCLVTGEKFSQQCILDDHPKFKFFMLGISYRDRNVLYSRINKRVDIMMEEGLLEEAKNYYETHPQGTSKQAIGYKELFPYFENKISLEAAVENIKKETRHYAKRQLTWFNREKNISWIYPDDYGNDKNKLFESAVSMIKDSGILGNNNEY